MSGGSSSSVWVLNEEIQIDENGELFSLQSSDYVWQPIGGPCIELLYARANNQVDLRSTIETPLSVDPLRELVQGTFTLCLAIIGGASAATIRSSKWKSAMDIWYVRFYLEAIGG